MELLLKVHLPLCTHQVIDHEALTSRSSLSDLEELIENSAQLQAGRVGPFFLWYHAACTCILLLAGLASTVRTQ